MECPFNTCSAERAQILLHRNNNGIESPITRIVCVNARFQMNTPQMKLHYHSILYWQLIDFSTSYPEVFNIGNTIWNSHSLCRRCVSKIFLRRLSDLNFKWKKWSMIAKMAASWKMNCYKSNKELQTEMKFVKYR